MDDRTFQDAEGNWRCGQPCTDGNAPELAQEQGLPFIACNNLVSGPEQRCQRHLEVGITPPS